MSRYLHHYYQMPINECLYGRNEEAKFVLGNTLIEVWSILVLD